MWVQFETQVFCRKCLVNDWWGKMGHKDCPNCRGALPANTATLKVDSKTVTAMVAALPASELRERKTRGK
jgi:hypothetical protein